MNTQLIKLPVEIENQIFLQTNIKTIIKSKKYYLLKNISNYKIIEFLSSSKNKLITELLENYYDDDILLFYLDKECETYIYDYFNFHKDIIKENKYIHPYILYYICARKNLKLLEFVEKIIPNIKEYLHYYIKSKGVRIIEFLLDKNLDITENNTYTFIDTLLWSSVDYQYKVSKIYLKFILNQIERLNHSGLFMPWNNINHDLCLNLYELVDINMSNTLNKYKYYNMTIYLFYIYFMLRNNDFDDLTIKDLYKFNKKIANIHNNNNNNKWNVLYIIILLDISVESYKFFNKLNITLNKDNIAYYLYLKDHNYTNAYIYSLVDYDDYDEDEEDNYDNLIIYIRNLYRYLIYNQPIIYYIESKLRAALSVQLYNYFYYNYPELQKNKYFANDLKNFIISKVE